MTSTQIKALDGDLLNQSNQRVSGYLLVFRSWYESYISFNRSIETLIFDPKFLCLSQPFPGEGRPRALALLFSVALFLCSGLPPRSSLGAMPLTLRACSRSAVSKEKYETALEKWGSPLAVRSWVRN